MNKEDADRRRETRERPVAWQIEYMDGHLSEAVYSEEEADRHIAASRTRTGYEMKGKRPLYARSTEAALTEMQGRLDKMEAVLRKELEHLFHDVRRAGGGPELERAIARQEAVEAALEGNAQAADQPLRSS